MTHKIVSISIGVMTENGFEEGDGTRKTYFVCINREDGGQITPHSYREEWKAKHETVEYAEFFGVPAIGSDGQLITESADDILFGDHT
jgi:hypothetical protein